MSPAGALGVPLNSRDAQYAAAGVGGGGGGGGESSTDLKTA